MKTSRTVPIKPLKKKKKKKKKKKTVKGQVEAVKTEGGAIWNKNKK